MIYQRFYITRTITMIVLNLNPQNSFQTVLNNVIRELIPSSTFCQIIQTNQYFILLYNSFRTVRMLSENLFQIKQQLILPKK